MIPIVSTCLACSGLSVSEGRSKTRAGDKRDQRRAGSGREKETPLVVRPLYQSSTDRAPGTGCDMLRMKYNSQTLACKYKLIYGWLGPFNKARNNITLLTTFVGSFVVFVIFHQKLCFFSVTNITLILITTEVFNTKVMEFAAAKEINKEMKMRKVRKGT